MLVQRDFVAVAEGLIAGTAAEPYLVGSQCEHCDTVTFPRQGSCPRCTSEHVRERLLSRRGTLWTWTVQCFPPKSPPYAVAGGRRGLRALRGGLRRAAGRGARGGAADRRRPSRTVARPAARR